MLFSACGAAIIVCGAWRVFDLMVVMDGLHGLDGVGGLQGDRM